LNTTSAQVKTSAYWSSVAPAVAQGRHPTSDADLKRWLQIMACYYRYSVDEIAGATGMTSGGVINALKRTGIDTARVPSLLKEASLLMLPYPGGRSPITDATQDAAWLRRDTKIGVFAPWDPHSYVVLDVPRMVTTGKGIIYPDCRTNPTIWTRDGVAIPPTEWRTLPGDTLQNEIALPNGIAIGVRATPTLDAVNLTLWLRNGTKRPMHYVVAQTMVLMSQMKGFEIKSMDDIILRPPYAVCRSTDGTRWVILAWNIADRVWADLQSPGIHCDPRFPDCAPDATSTVQGRFSFYSGSDIDDELKRIEDTGWRNTSERDTRNYDTRILVRR
jgi:hypothetical protein